MKAKKDGTCQSTAGDHTAVFESPFVNGARQVFSFIFFLLCINEY